MKEHFVPACGLILSSADTTDESTQFEWTDGHRRTFIYLFFQISQSLEAVGNV